MKVSDQLKSCPFCGSKAVMKHCDDIASISSNLNITSIRGKELTHFLVQCTECKVKTPAQLTKSGAFNFWNRRSKNINVKGVEL